MERKEKRGEDDRSREAMNEMDVFDSSSGLPGDTHGLTKLESDILNFISVFEFNKTKIVIKEVFPKRPQRHKNNKSNVKTHSLN